MIASDDVRRVTFDRAMRGYRCEDVDDYLKQVADSIDSLAAENDDLQKKLVILAQRIDQYRADEDTLSTTMINAQRLGENVIKEAKQKAAEIIRAAVVYEGFGPLTNGSNLLYGFTSFASFNLSLGSVTLHLETVMPFLFSGICIAIILLLINSTYGRAFKAIRDDEIAAEAMGINLASHKRMSFIISSFFAGISGAMLAMYQASVQATTFKSSMTYEILLIVVIGGIGCIGVHYSPVHEDVRQAVAPLPAWNGKHHLSFVYGGRAAGGHDCGLPPDGQSADIPCGVCCCYACRIFLCTADLSLL